MDGRVNGHKSKQFSLFTHLTYKFQTMIPLNCQRSSPILLAHTYLKIFRIFFCSKDTLKQREFQGNIYIFMGIYWDLDMNYIWKNIINIELQILK